MHDHQPGTLGEAESRADVAEQNDLDPDFEADLVEAGDEGVRDGVVGHSLELVESGFLMCDLTGAKEVGL